MMDKKFEEAIEELNRVFKEDMPEGVEAMSADGLEFLLDEFNEVQTNEEIKDSATSLISYCERSKLHWGQRPRTKYRLPEVYKGVCDFYDKMIDIARRITESNGGQMKRSIENQCNIICGAYQTLDMLPKEYIQSVINAVEGFKDLPWERLAEFPNDFPSELDRLSQGLGKDFAKSYTKGLEKEVYEAVTKRTAGGKNLYKTLYHNFAHISFQLGSFGESYKRCKHNEKERKSGLLLHFGDIHKNILAQLVAGANGLAELLVCAFDETLDEKLAIESCRAGGYLYGKAISDFMLSYKYLSKKI